ncbi:MAG: SAM-dependent chlorinase/fluorinase [Deltaproteobacteria bacterium]|nr:SAM-dependent chlorinase/fluorinase [Deltaproteobacteria bacterium]
MLKHPIITLLTDFGTKDHYVASMKGVILRINPRCKVVDITHQVEPQDIVGGAFLLANAFSYFPEGTVHLAVVDPEVGRARKSILIVTKNYFFIGPDNGLLEPAAKKDGIERIVVLTDKKYFLPEISATFHGRDIFAPVAGHLSLGIAPPAFGKKAGDCERLDVGQPEIRGNRLTGRVIHIDHFGNLISNIEKEEFIRFIKDRPFLISAGKKMIQSLKRGYYEGNKNVPIALFGSGGYLEISVREGNAQKMLKVKRGDGVQISTKSQIPNPQ